MKPQRDQHNVKVPGNQSPSSLFSKESLDSLLIKVLGCVPQMWCQNLSLWRVWVQFWESTTQESVQMKRMVTKKMSLAKGLHQKQTNQHGHFQASNSKNLWRISASRNIWQMVCISVLVRLAKPQLDTPNHPVEKSAVEKSAARNPVVENLLVAHDESHWYSGGELPVNKQQVRNCQRFTWPQAEIEYAWNKVLFFCHDSKCSIMKNHEQKSKTLWKINEHITFFCRSPACRTVFEISKPPLKIVQRRS